MRHLHLQLANPQLANPRARHFRLFSCCCLRCCGSRCIGRGSSVVCILLDIRIALFGRLLCRCSCSLTVCFFARLSLSCATCCCCCCCIACCLQTFGGLLLLLFDSSLDYRRHGLQQPLAAVSSLTRAVQSHSHRFRWRRDGSNRFGGSSSGFRNECCLCSFSLKPLNHNNWHCQC